MWKRTLSISSPLNLGGDELVYCDPPYLPSTRRRARVYRHDYRESDHVRLLETLQKLPCRVVVSAYPSELYDESLCGWHSKTFAAKAHDGIRQEKIWFNFDPPAQLHDARRLKRDFRERQTINRRLQRLQERHSIGAATTYPGKASCNRRESQLLNKARQPA